MTKISVLTTVYNGRKYLAEAIESVLNQTWVNFEFIIIDDASTDNSVEIIKSYNDSRIRFFKNEIPSSGLFMSIFYFCLWKSSI